MAFNGGRNNPVPAPSLPDDYWKYAPPWAYPHPTFNFTTTTTEPPEVPDTCPDMISSDSGGGAASVIAMNIFISFILFVIGIGVFIFATRSARNQARKPLLNRKQSTGSDWIRTFYSQRKVDEDLGSSRTSTETTNDVINDASADELGFWLPIFWFWKTEEIERRCGKSATQYLRFMEHMMLFTAVIVAVGTILILPLNVNGRMIKAQLDFGRTSLLNINPRSSVLWVHTGLSLCLFPLAVYFMRMFGRKFRGYTHPFRATKTLMFDHLNVKTASEDRLRQHFQQAFPEAPIEDVKLTYRTAKLMKLDEQLQKCNACLRYYERTLSLGEDRPSYTTDNVCLRCCCCCCEVGVDAIEFYSAKALELENRIEELIDVPKKPNTTFFVTFQTEDAAKQVLSRYKSIWKSVFSPTTTVSSLLRARFWIAKYAPYPEFIKWQNLQVGGAKWFLYAVLLNFGLLVFLFFVTSPVIILNALGLTNWAKDLLIINQILPALLLIELGLIIGGLVKFVTKRTRYHDKITELINVMVGSFAFALLTQLILPTFGLTSAKALYDYLVDAAEVPEFKWACIFLPDSGMVFVSYFIYQSLFGTSLNLSRITQLQVRAIRRFTRPSEAEKYLVSQKRKSFTFGTSYASNVVQVSIIVVFIFITPYLGPFGLFAMMMNHIAERYNLFFVNRVKEVPNLIHKTAVNLFLFAVLFELFILLFFLGIRSSPVGMFALVIAAVVYTGIYSYIVWLKQFGRISKVPIIGSVLAHHLDEDEDADSYDPVAEPQNYDAPILRRYEMLRPLTSPPQTPRRQPELAWHER